jgi:Fe-S cluster assembly protein SufD
MMNVVLAKTESGKVADRLFARTSDRLPGSGKVAEARRHALETFEREGLPHRRLEEWKYTDLRALMREVLPLAPRPDAAALGRARGALTSIAINNAASLVLVDGVFSPELSESPGAGVSVRALREALESGGDLPSTRSTDAMVSLNAALAADGVLIDVADGVALARQTRQSRASDAGREFYRCRGRESVSNA